MSAPTHNCPECQTSLPEDAVFCYRCGTATPPDATVAEPGQVADALALEEVQAALGERYTVKKPLGEGGMAMVYLAEDGKHQRKVAVKVLRPELSATLAAERFLLEIETIAIPPSPNGFSTLYRSPSAACTSSSANASAAWPGSATVASGGVAVPQR